MSENHPAVRLRPLEDDDLPEILGWFKGEVGRLAHGVHGQVEAEDLTSTSPGTGLRVAVTDDEGIVGVFNWVDQGSGSYFIGIAVAPHLVGSGYGMFIVEQGIGHLFDQLRAHRIELRAATFNHHVMGMLRAGFMTLEGVLRDTIFVDGRYASTVVASMLEGEYREHVAAGRIYSPTRNFEPQDLDRGARALRAALGSPRVSRSWDTLRDRADVSA
ncbi:GNAT family N-acetyltransferase [Phycicoccus flavus]|uniref:GNAT family N-acetyltransferase n=1 Tax=Phycicoccus flavus TaxID=2502783 RepID=UPI000FEC2087|nr:GNAT family protein [Phycicoccus flavus]NHA66995.1 GNAT family N-acetyltransferase [Phycicoccus flavus]